jgi:hypothetical protein
MTVLNIYIYIYIYGLDNTTEINHLNITLIIDDFRRIPKLLCGFCRGSKRKLFY